jgi:hypothetical protein
MAFVCSRVAWSEYPVSMYLHIGQPTYEKVNEELFLDNPLHVTLNNSKLADRIYVILIANKELIKKKYFHDPLLQRGFRDGCCGAHTLPPGKQKECPQQRIS